MDRDVSARRASTSPRCPRCASRRDPATTPIGSPLKTTPEIKRQITELTIAHPKLSDFQPVELLDEPCAIVVSRSTVNRTRHLPHFGDVRQKGATF